MITQREVHENAKSKGFHAHPRGCGTAVAIAMIASEAFEALEAHRRWNDDQLREELADVVLRTMDLAEQLGFDVLQAAAEKHRLNLERPFKHGDRRY